MKSFRTLSAVLALSALVLSGCVKETFQTGIDGSKPADANGNGTLTLSEIYNYVYTKVYNQGPFWDGEEYVYQNVQVYPTNSSYALFK